MEENDDFCETSFYLKPLYQLLADGKVGVYAEYDVPEDCNSIQNILGNSDRRYGGVDAQSEIGKGQAKIKVFNPQSYIL